MPRKTNWKRQEIKAKRALDRNRARIEAASPAGTKAGRSSSWRLKEKRDDG